MRAGRLRDVIRIQQAVQVKTQHAELQDDWQDVPGMPVRAGIFPVSVKDTVAKESGREYFENHEHNREINVRIELRYIQGIKQAMRVVCGDRIFDIIIPIDLNNAHRDLHLWCVERYSEGS
jgi:SPP1 family predicted phage head-tail adaptor